jgi:menaquinone-dependent protoporphyrinogen oxidase
MRVLVTAASKHGGTQEIAAAIAAELVSRGLEVTQVSVEEVGSIDGYDAVVLGSAVYLGKWMKSAKTFAARESASLSAMPVWLFSSGPVGGAASKPEDEGDRREGDALPKQIGAREHRLFAGKLDRSGLSVIERAAVKMAKAADGDYRPWDEIRAWARSIADALRSTVSA